jgi:hypothetical protein
MRRIPGSEAEQLQPFRREWRVQVHRARHITAGMRNARDQPRFDRVDGQTPEHDGDRLRGIHCGTHGRQTVGHDHIYLLLDELACKRWQSVRHVVVVAPFPVRVLILDPAKLLHEKEVRTRATYVVHGEDYVDQWRRAATFVDKILKVGSETPVER